MTNKTNLKIDDDVHEQHNEQRKAEGLSWSEYLRRCEYQGDGVDEERVREIAREVVQLTVEPEAIRERRRGESDE